MTHLALADSLIADHTPEAIVVDGQGIVRYRGRIDDNQRPHSHYSP